MAAVSIPSPIRLMVSSTSTHSSRLTIATGCSPCLTSLTLRLSGLAQLLSLPAGMQLAMNFWMKILPLRQSLLSLLLKKHLLSSLKILPLLETWRFLHSNKAIKSPLTCMLFAQDPTNIMKTMSLGSLPWESTPESPSLVTATSKRCSELHRQELSSTQFSSVLSTPSTNTTRSLSLSIIQARWKMSDLWPIMRAIFSEVKFLRWPRDWDLRAQICTSSHTCGSETSSQWSGGMICGLTKVLPHLCPLLLWIKLQKSLSLRLTGSLSCSISSGESVMTNSKRLTQSLARSVIQEKLRLCLTVSLTVKVPHYLSRSTTCWEEKW